MPRAALESLPARLLLAVYAPDVSVGFNGRIGGGEHVALAAVQGGRVVVAEYDEPDDYTTHFSVRRYHDDGTPDARFAEITGTADESTGAVDATGRVYLADLNGVLTRFTARGRVDRTFGTRGRLDLRTGDGATTASAILPLADGSAIVELKTLSGSQPTTIRLCHVTADGKLDTGFGPAGGRGYVTLVSNRKSQFARVLLAVDAEGRTYVTTPEYDADGTARVVNARIRRLTASGVADTSFADGGVLTPSGDGFTSFTVDSSGRVLVAAEDAHHVTVRRYTSAGVPDTAFASGGTATFRPVDRNRAVFQALLPQADGTLYVEANDRVYKLTAAGQYDTTFAGGGQADLIGGSIGNVTKSSTIIGVLNDGAFVAQDEGDIDRFAPAPVAAIDADHNQLYVNGTAGDDTVTIHKDGSSVRVTVNGHTEIFDYADAYDLSVNLLGGNNKVTSDLDYSTFVRTGNGNDTISVAGDDANVDFGAGDNTVAFAKSGTVDNNSSDRPLGHNTVTGGSAGGELFYGVNDPSSSATIDYTGSSAYVDVSGSAQSNSVTLNVTEHGLAYTGSGNDSIDISAGGGYARVQPGDGRDTVRTGAGRDRVTTDATNLTNDDDTYDLGGGDDVLIDNSGNNTVVGGTGNDSIRTGGGADVLTGGDGNDTLRGGDGADTLDGGLGRDRLFGNGGADSLIGDGSNDTIVGGTGNDALFGNGGDDTLYAGDIGAAFVSTARNRANGGPGKDVLWKENANDTDVNVESLMPTS